MVVRDPGVIVEKRSEKKGKKEKRERLINQPRREKENSKRVQLGVTRNGDPTNKGRADLRRRRSRAY